VVTTPTPDPPAAPVPPPGVLPQNIDPPTTPKQEATPTEQEQNPGKLPRLSNIYK